MFQPILKLSASEMERIQRVAPILKKIEGFTQVPWQLLAGIWYRESFSVSPPVTPGGPWQFDPPPTPAVIRRYLMEFSHLTQDQQLQVAKKGINDFYAGGILAACHLQSKMEGGLTLRSPDSAVQKAIFRYNGTAYGSPEKSPYVMNGYSSQYSGMRIIGTIPTPEGGRQHINTVDKRPGAFVVYQQLKQQEETASWK